MWKAHGNENQLPDLNIKFCGCGRENTLQLVRKLSIPNKYTAGFAAY
jgi:hypothetical protein